MNLVDRIAAVEARYHDETLAPERRAEFYVRDLATLFEAMAFYTRIVETKDAQIAALKTPPKPGSVEALIRDGASPADVIRAGIQSGLDHAAMTGMSGKPRGDA